MAYKDPEKQRAAQRASMARYRATPEGQAYMARYKASPEGRAAEARYKASPKRRASKARYDASPKGGAATARRWHRRLQIRIARKQHDLMTLLAQLKEPTNG